MTSRSTSPVSSYTRWLWVSRKAFPGILTFLVRLLTLQSISALKTVTSVSLSPRRLQRFLCTDIAGPWHSRSQKRRANFKVCFWRTNNAFPDVSTVTTNQSSSLQRSWDSWIIIKKIHLALICVLRASFKIPRHTSTSRARKRPPECHIANASMLMKRNTRPVQQEMNAWQKPLLFLLQAVSSSPAASATKLTIFSARCRKRSDLNCAFYTRSNIHCWDLIWWVAVPVVLTVKTAVGQHFVVDN